MQKRIGWLIVTILVLGSIYTWAHSAVQLEGSDGSQIRSAILSAVDAANQGRVSEAMSVISPDYKDSMGMNHDRLWVLVRRAVDNRQYWSVTARRVTPAVEGPNASAEVDIIVNVDGEPHAREYMLSLAMQREDTHVWGVIPTQRWRITTASGLPEDVMALSD